MGKYRRINFSNSFLLFRTRSQFCSPGSIYFSLLAIQQCKIRIDWRNFVTNILGTGENHFSNIAPLTLYMTGDFYWFLVNFATTQLKNKNRYAFFSPGSIHFRPSSIYWYNFKTDWRNFVKNILGAENWNFFTSKRASQIFAQKPRGYNFFSNVSQTFLKLAWFEIISEGFILITRTSPTV